MTIEQAIAALEKQAAEATGPDSQGAYIDLAVARKFAAFASLCNSDTDEGDGVNAIVTALLEAMANGTLVERLF